MAQAAPLRAGDEPFPGFRLDRLIGSGGFAEVWAAESVDGREMALKFLPTGNRWTTPQEIRSLQFVQKFQHPHLVRIDSIWCQPGYIVVAMELADGSLADLLEVCRRDFATSLTPELVCHYLRQAATAIDFLNTPQHHGGERRAAIRHCDIKPSNLLLFGDTVKLADFGLASLRTSLPSVQAPAGTPAYAAPEVFEGRVSDRTDQFALAVTYCELRGGRLPFAYPPAGFKRNYKHPPPDLSMLTMREVPIIARSLSPNPTDRWPSCTEMMSALEPACSRLVTSA